MCIKNTVSDIENLSSLYNNASTKENHSLKINILHIYVWIS